MSNSIRALALVPLGLLLLMMTRSEAGLTLSHPNAPCRTCHLAGEATTRVNASQLTKSQETLCKECHSGAQTVAHPTGFQPARMLPREYPLDWKGDVTCSTCHDVHSHKSGYLRGKKRYREMCLTCHNDAFFQRMADSGLSLQLSAHIGATPSDLPSLVDSYSLHCLSCHSDESDVGAVQVDNRGLLRHQSGTANHPIGSTYMAAALRGRYRPVGAIDKNIVLPEGKLSCISCHTGFAARHGALVMSNGASALCLECHDV